MRGWGCVLVLVAALPGAATARADDSQIGKERVELTPFYGWRTGGSFTVVQGGAHYGISSSASFGGLLDVNLHVNNFKLEALFSHQETDVQGSLVSAFSGLTIDYYQAGILQEIGNQKTRFFVSALLGATHLAPARFASETRFSASLGAGLKLFPSRHVGIRIDARAYVTVVKGSSGLFCSGGCIFVYSGSELWQGDFTGGIIFAF